MPAVLTYSLELGTTQKENVKEKLWSGAKLKITYVNITIIIESKNESECSLFH